jgi:hypothetical protein
MLANQPDNSPQAGALRGDVQKPATFRHELVNFIANELPQWRDRADRRRETAETALTSQLCAHLNSVARHARGWDILQFRVEEPDEEQRGRRIDLVASPSGTSITIEGRKHVDFDPIMPVECKRMPTPKAKDRDEREYVFTEGATTGGIQRFKAGLHGAVHNFGAMIGYVQEEDAKFWNERIAGWIGDLVDKKSGWTRKDMLHLRGSDETLGTALLNSSHARSNGLPDIELCHLWIEMN